MCASTWAAKSSGLQSRSGTTSVRSSPWWTVCPETEPTLLAMVEPLRLLLWRESSTGDVVEGSRRAVAILFSVRVKLVGSRTACCKPRRGFGRTGRDVKVLSKCGGALEDTRPLGRCCCSSWAEGTHEAKSRGLVVVWREKVSHSHCTNCFWYHYGERVCTYSSTTSLGDVYAYTCTVEMTR